MRACDLTKRAELSVEQVRYNTRIGLLRPAQKRRNNYHSYQETDVARLRFVRQAKNLGYTLGEIAKIFEMSNHGESPCPPARDIITHLIGDNRKNWTKCLNCNRE